ncbi:2048_t:CDS:2, partial [Racocetra fulgida]
AIEISKDSSADEIKIKSKKQKTVPKESSLSEAEKLHAMQSIIIPISYPLLQTGVAGINQEMYNQFYSNSSLLQLNNLRNRKLSIPSLDNFLTQVDSEYGNTGEYILFKDAFENENITTDMLSDLTDNEFKKLGVNKIGWRKV